MPSTTAAPSRALNPEVLCCALLCLACGVVDAVGFMRHGVFAANMTGNTVLLGIAVAQAHWVQALERLSPLLAFFVGAMAARLLLSRSGQRAWIPLLLEAVLIALAAFIIDQAHLALFVIAFAMGLQAAAVTKFAGLALSTVVITSTMARIAERVADRLGGAPAAAPTPGAPAPGPLYAMTWACYLVGALVAALELRFAPVVMIGAGVLVAAAAWTTRSSAAR